MAVVPPNNQAAVALPAAVLRYATTLAGNAPLAGTNTIGPCAAPATAPPASASGKATPLANPTAFGDAKNACATSTAVANRSAPTNGVADRSAVAAGPPMA